MPPISLSNFVNVASKTAPDQKLTVADGAVETRQSSQTVRGRVVSWITSHVRDNPQNAADQTAFRTALVDRYKTELGTRAYDHACTACGHSGSRSHSLTSKQVLAAENYATRNQEDKNFGITKAELAEKNACLEAKAQVPEKIDEHPDQSALYFTVPLNSDVRVTNEQIRQTGVNTLNGICERVELKYGIKVADAVKKELHSSNSFENLHRQPSEDPNVSEDPNDAKALVRSVRAFIDTIWLEAQSKFVDTFPGKAGEELRKLDKELLVFRKKNTPQPLLDHISEKYGLKKGTAFAYSRTYTEDSNKRLMNWREAIALEALSLGVEKVLSQTQENGGELKVTNKSFSTVLADAQRTRVRDEALFTKEHLAEVTRESAALVVEDFEPPAKPLESILKSSEAKSETASKKTVHWG